MKKQNLFFLLIKISQKPLLLVIDFLSSNCILKQEHTQAIDSLHNFKRLQLLVSVALLIP